MPNAHYWRARNAEYNAKDNTNCQVMPGKNANCQVISSFMPSKVTIAKFYAEFFEIKVLLLVQLPGTINRKNLSIEKENTQTQHTHTHTQ